MKGAVIFGANVNLKELCEIIKILLIDIMNVLAKMILTFVVS